MAPVSKRGNGEGSIYQRPDGRWVASVMVGRTAAGKPDRRGVYGKTRAEVQKRLDGLRRRSAAGLLWDRRVERDTVEALLLAWLDGKRGTVDAQSWRRHENNVRGHLVPALGHLKAGALKADDLRRLFA